METRLEIDGYGGQTIPVDHVATGAGELAVFLPGLRYSCERPLLHFPELLMRARGADILRVNYRYDLHTPFRDAGGDEQLAWLRDDGRRVFDFVAALGYERVTVFGKSLGTIVMGGNLPAEARCAWLTPSIGGTGLTEQILAHAAPAIMVIGTRDPACRPDLMGPLSGHARMTVTVVDGADHVFLPPDGDALGALEMTRQATSAIADWLSATDPGWS